MNRAETARLLGLAAAFDQRTVGDADVVAWSTVLDWVPFTDGVAAVKAHYAVEVRRVMPADVLGFARRVRRDRLDATVLPEPPAGLSAAGFVAWKQATLRAIGDGSFVAPVRVELPARDVRGLLSSAFRSAEEAS